MNPVSSSSSSFSLPMEVAGLTAEWLTLALQQRHAGVVVHRVEMVGVQAGTASKVCVDLDYRDSAADHALPRRFYVKGGFHGPEQLALSGGGYAREAGFYAEHVAHLGDLELPRAYFAAADAASGQGIVLLEDLTQRGARFGHATRPVSVDTAAATLAWMAALHGRSWGAAHLERLQAWPGIIRDVMSTLLSPAYWEPALDRPLAAPVPTAMRDPERVKRALAAMWQYGERSPHTFIHGDAHLGNMYFLPDGRPGYLDWQSPMRGPAMDDVTYFLIGSLSIEDRRKHEAALVRHYLDCLSAYPGAAVPSFDEAWLAYRQQVMHGFTWVATPAQMQPDEVVATSTERFCTALQDLDTLQALGVAPA